MHSLGRRAALASPAFCVIIAGNHNKRRRVQIKAASQQTRTEAARSAAACAKRSLGSGRGGGGGGRQFYIYRGDNRTKSSLNANQIHHRPNANVCLCIRSARLIKTLLPVYLSLSAGAAIIRCGQQHTWNEIVVNTLRYCNMHVPNTAG